MYYSADYRDLTATTLVSQNPVCQYTSFKLSLNYAYNVYSCTWQQKSAGSTTWTDIANSTSTDAVNGFPYSPAGLYMSTTYRAKLVGCTSNPYTPITYSSEIEVKTINTVAAAGEVVGERDVITGNNQGVLTFANHAAAVKYWESSQDNGNTWTTIYQTGEELPYENLTTNTLFRAVTTVCGSDQRSANCIIRVHAADYDISWTETKGFGLDGTTLLGNSRTYVDGFTKPLQSQSKSLSKGKILATQPLYGKYDQAVGSTLAAPITATDFSYTPSFIAPTSDGSAAYDYTRFDDGTKLNAPEAVSTTKPNTLGWYYSTSNALEPYTAITGLPYSRTDAMPDGSTGVSRSAGPGVGLQLGSGREVVQGTFPVRTELDTYAAIRNGLLSSAAVGGQLTTMQQAAVQSLSTDADGNTALVFADKEGHPVMSARPATAADAWLTASNTVEVGWPYKVQIKDNITLTTPLQFTCTADIMAFDNQGKWLVTGSPDQVAQTIKTGVNIQNYLFFSTDPFTVINDPGAGAIATIVPSQQREAYPFFNFYVVGDGSVTIVDKPGTPGSTYSLVNTVTGNPVTFTNSTPLPPGCYQLRIDKGAVSLSYANRYKDLSYSFYNQKGQLVESIAPNGVQQLLLRWTPGGTITQPSYITTFEYDQQGRQVAMNEADAGRTEFYYRTDGKLRFSQNAKQRVNGYFSYLNYDTIGRVNEAGENQGGSTVFANCKANLAVLDYIAPYGAYDDGKMGCQNRKDVVRTYYDQASGVQVSGFTLPAGYTPTFLSGRVVATQKASLFAPCAAFQEVSHTVYSYDEQGRTQWQVQQTTGQPTRTIDYTYDVAGNTATVCYQKNAPVERLTHYYTYDADNRLSTVSTDKNDPASSIPAGRTEHARYTYYLHGPLKRVVYGFDATTGRGLQGVDYTYTATGQLKAINDGDLQQDPGLDATGTSQYADFFGTSLNYYPNDYASAAVLQIKTTMVTPSGDYQPHYNGLVSGTSWQTPGSPLHAYGYNYDYKGQLLTADHGLLTNAGNRQYTFATDGGRYRESLPFSSTTPSYDLNGNINRLQRTDGAGWNTMDAGYEYLSGTNKLNIVRNLATGAPLVTYQYDNIGQAISQQESDPTQSKYLDYDAAGKVTALYATADHSQVISRYTYDEFGRRLIQQVYPTPTDQTTYTTTSFVRDAVGHELASYVAETKAGATAAAFLYEQPIYGATRLGIYRQARDQMPAEQLYELNDQLGNTRVVFRKPVSTSYVLSMEPARTSQEQQDFPAPSSPTTYNTTRSADYAYGLSTYNASTGSHYSVKLLYVSGQNQSPSKIIPAQLGDKVHFTAYALYSGTSSGGGVATNVKQPEPTPVSALAVGLASVRVSAAPRLLAETTPPGSPGWQSALSRVSLGVSIPLLAHAPKPMALTSGTGTPTTLSAPPNAYLQYLVRKASDYSLVRSGSTNVTAASQDNWQLLTLDVTITETYPVLIEVSARNSSSNLAAYFDDLTAQYTPGPVVEENHFYAYGQRNEGLSWRRSEERLYGRGYQGQNTTQDAESGYTAFDLRMYDARYGRWLRMDPAGQYASPYIGLGNNPVNGIDRNGGFKEYSDDYTGTLGKGDWKTSDRVDNTSVWQNANIYNLGQSTGYNEYTTISQRTDFYKWFAADVAAKGFEVNWPGAASIVASQMANLDNKIVAWWVGDDVVKFGNEGNTAIFNDVFDNLAALRNGPVLKGVAAQNWDAVTLHHEQFDVVQPIYMKQSPETINELSLMAKVQNSYRLGATGGLRFEGNIMSPADRYNYGATKATFFYKLQTTYKQAGW